MILGYILSAIILGYSAGFVALMLGAGWWWIAVVIITSPIAYPLIAWFCEPASRR